MPELKHFCRSALLGTGDYDLAGGSGNGPTDVGGQVTVTGSDPFGLDADGDGIGCESC